LKILTKIIIYQPIKISINFEAILEWNGIKRENDASLGSCSGNDRSGIRSNLAIEIVLPPEKRF
jgi:hypothetical protein